jgi:hypothetical protein
LNETKPKQHLHHDSEQKACIVRDPTKGVKVNASDCGPKKFREEIKEKVRKLKESGTGVTVMCIVCPLV